MRLPFTLSGLQGDVDVTLEPNDDPESLGCRPAARGFPVCTAMISFAGRGYAAMLGWIQLVRSTDAPGGDDWAMDPYEPLGALSHPFCWFGHTPTLFDAPSRDSRSDVDWLAHSFLAFISREVRPQEIRAILGFSWGFVVRAGAITLREPSAVSPADWDGHLALLRSEHPTWSFADGFHAE